jgi:hypothetical protein
VRQPEPNRDSEAFLSALADELFAPIDDLMARSHVVAAASAARAARASRRAGAIGWAAAVTVVTVLGTGGIAAAGGLPAPLQVVVADMARALPVPIHVPYPMVGAPDARTAEPVEDLLRPEDGDVEVEPYEPSSRSEPAPSPDPIVVEDDLGIDVRGEREEIGRCDLGDRWEDRDDLDEAELDEIRDRIRNVCGLEFVDPPRFTEGDELDDADDSEHRDWDGRDDHEGDRGGDGDFRSSDSGHWDDGDGYGGDGQEEQQDG